MSDQTLFDEGYWYGKVKVTKHINMVYNMDLDASETTIPSLAIYLVHNDIEDINCVVSDKMPLWFVRGVRAFVDDLARVMHGLDGDFYVASFDFMKGV